MLWNLFVNEEVYKMTENKYTARQWAEMYGGHEMTEEQKGLPFMQTLGEARMFRSKDQIKREGARNTSDHLFATLMSLYTMSQDYKYAPVAKEYARRTMQFGNFNNPSPSGSDLYQTMFTLKRGDDYFGKARDTMLMDKVRVDEPRIKRFLQQLRAGTVNTSQASQMFFKLERDLKVQDPKLKATRRLVQNWGNLSSQQQQLAGNQLNRYYKMFARRSDMAPLYANYAKDSGFVLDKAKKSSIGIQVARKVGAFAAGYAIGKAIPS